MSKPDQMAERQRAAFEQQQAAPFIGRKGEIVRCEKGHQICSLACDIPAGTSYMELASYTDWKVAAPGEDMLGGSPSCGIDGCQGLWINGGGRRRLRFGGGWR